MSRLRLDAASSLLAAGLLAGVAAAGASAEETAQASSTSAPEMRTIVAGKEFDRSGQWRYWFLEGYRRAWAAPAGMRRLLVSPRAYRVAYQVS